MKFNQVQEALRSVERLIATNFTDHSSQAYFERIEKHWIRADVASKKSDQQPFQLLESLFYIMDKLAEDCKVARQNKKALRVLVAEVLKLRPLLNATSDFLLVMKDSHRSDVVSHLLLFVKLVRKVYNEVVKCKSSIPFTVSLSNYWSKVMRKFSHLIPAVQIAAVGLADKIKLDEPEIYAKHIPNDAEGFRQLALEASIDTFAESLKQLRKSEERFSFALFFKFKNLTQGYLLEELWSSVISHIVDRQKDPAYENAGPYDKLTLIWYLVDAYAATNRLDDAMAALQVC
jgi:hypothetical protein